MCVLCGVDVCAGLSVTGYMCAGCDVNATDSNNRTPMHLAAEKGHLEVVLALRTAGERALGTHYD